MPHGEACRWEKSVRCSVGGVEGAAALSPEDEDALDADVSAFGVVVLPEPPPLKSVAYQPLPLSWKPAADSCLVKVDAPQDGQSVSGAALIFCITSFSKPQDEQR